jgi:hypothetical protein
LLNCCKVSGLILSSEWYAIKSKKELLEEFCQGFWSVVPKKLITVLTVAEFEMMFNGLKQIDVDDWEFNTIYQDGYHKAHKVVKWWWEILHTYSQTQLEKILRYTTGSNTTPVEGFRGLESNRGNYAKFCLQKVEYKNENSLPKSHTCFNRLMLPCYPSKKDLEKSLGIVLKMDFDGHFGIE